MIPPVNTFNEWASDWNLPPAALQDLRARLSQVPPSKPGTPEGRVQQEIRIDAAHKGILLWRNNNGACEDSKTGRVIRYGLGNDSKKINSRIKSSDLIGVTPVVIGPEDVGRFVGIFTSLEVKRSGWVYKGTAREKAQLAWLRLVETFGGIARFTTGVGGD